MHSVYVAVDCSHIAIDLQIDMLMSTAVITALGQTASAR